MRTFDWASMVRHGVHGLSLKPHEFWALTPAEFLLMLGVSSGDGPLTRDRLAELQAAFPDQIGETDG